jgi:hypothetical protein
MSFDGDFQTESKRTEKGDVPFNSIEEAWEHSGDIGSKWFFYPFHFVTSDSTKTIKDAPGHSLKHFIGCRTETVVKIFKALHTDPETVGLEPDAYAVLAMNKLFDEY